jgi:serine protease Do
MAALAAVAASSSSLVADDPVRAGDRELKAGVERARASVCRVECLDRTGASTPSVLSAVAIDDEGYLVTVGLRTPGDRRLCVRDHLGKKHEAHWIASDPVSGLTLLKVEPGVFRSPQISASLPEVGSTVMVIGNPFGLSHSVSVGNVSGLDRSVSLSSGVGRGLIQFTAPVFPGDSGGLLADRDGRMLGVVSTALGEPAVEGGGERRVQGISFAIPADELRLVARRLRDGEKAERGYLGITVEDAEPAGARITSVSPASPAETAGLKVGDVIESIDGAPVNGFEDLATRIERLRPGTSVKLSVKRGDEQIALDVALGERKPTASPNRRSTVPNWSDRFPRLDPNSLRELRDIEAWTRNWPVPGPEGVLLGVQTQPVTESLAKTLEFESTDGALVNSVVPGSPADRAGLRTSDLIVEIDEEPVKSPLELHERIQKAGPGAKIRVGVVRDGERKTLEATLAPQPLTFGPGDVPMWPRAPRVGVSPDQTATRIEAIEERVRVLEKRIEELERRLQGRGENPAPTGDKR